MNFEQDNTNEFVEAIEEGKIVRVSEKYAKREGLPILRKQQVIQFQRTTSQLHQTKLKSMLEQDKRHPTDYLKRKPEWKEKQVISELVDNFNWTIKSERRKKGITRSQLAKLINEPENNIKMLEFGVLPSPDFLLINKIQNALNINLRKDGRDFSKPPASDILSQAKTKMMKKEDEKEKTSVSGAEIEIDYEEEN